MNTKKRLFQALAFLLFCGCIAQGCASLMSVAGIAGCKFRMESVSNTKLSGVNIQDKPSVKSLSLNDAGRLATGYLNKNLPLTFNLNLEGTNPNAREAALHGFDWILLIDEVEMARGRQDQQISIPGNDGKSLIPMNISLNLFEVLSDRSRDALLNFAFNLADDSGTPTRLGIKIKPTVFVHGVALSYPEYISLGTSF
ncbi:MAG: hypothetical protein ACFCUU_00225 [Cyclobacteriaceae bacterium]